MNTTCTHGAFNSSASASSRSDHSTGSLDRQLLADSSLSQAACEGPLPLRDVVVRVERENDGRVRAIHLLGRMRVKLYQRIKKVPRTGDLNE